MSKIINKGEFIKSLSEEQFNSVKLKCHGDDRPTIDPDWVKEIFQNENDRI